MSAHADDLRYFYAEDIGITVEATPAAGVSSRLPEALTPGRYVLRIVDFNGASDVWIRQGGEDVEAQAGYPSMRFRGHAEAAELNKPLLFFMVRAGGRGQNPDPARNQLAFFPVGAVPTIQITKVSRDKQ